jgi:hypothetical protein
MQYPHGYALLLQIALEVAYTNLAKMKYGGRKPRVHPGNVFEQLRKMRHIAGAAARDNGDAHARADGGEHFQINPARTPSVSMLLTTSSPAP